MQKNLSVEEGNHQSVRFVFKEHSYHPSSLESTGYL